MTLLEQFQNMKHDPIIEINWKDYNGELDDDWEIFTIQADEHGVYTIVDDGLIVVQWDDIFSLDEHLQELYTDILGTKL
jgi:hypothetical protein